MDALQALKENVINTLDALNISLSQDQTPATIGGGIRDAREATKRLEIADENYLRAHQPKAGKK
jgi:hypothetical protein